MKTNETITVTLKVGSDVLEHETYNPHHAVRVAGELWYEIRHDVSETTPVLVSLILPCGTRLSVGNQPADKGGWAVCAVAQEHGLWTDETSLFEAIKAARNLRDRYEFRVRIQGGIGGLDFA